MEIKQFKSLAKEQENAKEGQREMTAGDFYGNTKDPVESVIKKISE